MHETARAGSFGLAGGFTDAQLDRIYDDTLQVLAEIGMEVADVDIREFLGGLPGITVAGERVCRKCDGHWLCRICEAAGRKQPDLVFEHSDREQLHAAAAEKAKRLVAEHDHALPEDAQRDVERVYQAACADLLG